ncbi:MAG TPA: hypothetical protein QF873_00820 [Patescibacteria group bacterium]|nr:hypothetical protein [Patescibacteria group bacterium]
MEVYGVQCPARHFRFNPFCRSLELLHPFVNGFPGTVEIVKNAWNFGELVEQTVTMDHWATSGLTERAVIKYRVPASYKEAADIEDLGMGLAFEDDAGTLVILTGMLSGLHDGREFTCAIIQEIYSSAELVSCEPQDDGIHFVYHGVDTETGFVKGVAFVEEGIPVMISTIRAFDTHWDDAVLAMVRSTFQLELVD